MAIVPVPLLGQFGISLDIPPAELPPNAWSNGYNARFKDGVVQTMNGDKKLWDIAKQPQYAIQVLGPQSSLASWVVAAEDSAYTVNGLAVTDITPTTPGAGPSDAELAWSGCSLGQQTILNDTYRTPWYWAAPSPADKMVPLPNWPDNTTCYTLRSFKQTLVALNVTKDGDEYPSMVKWSHPADPGQPPISWDEADETKDAGETVLAETSGYCVDAVSLRDSCVIYKTDSVWSMQYIGGLFIYRFTKLFGDWGMPVRGCAVEFTAGQHFVFTGTDIYVHDGNTARSILKGKVKNLLRSITLEQLPTCFVVNNPAYNEVWFCWKRDTASVVVAADTAIVWNVVENTISLRVLPSFTFIAPGRVDTTSAPQVTWDSNSDEWDQSGVIWAEFAQIPAYMRLLALGPLAGWWCDGQNSMLSPFFLERTYVGIPVRAGQPPDLSSMKFVRRVWPRFTGEAGTQLQVTFGSADSVGEPIKWRNPLKFTIGTTRKFDITLSGKVMAIRIEADTLSGGDPPVEPVTQEGDGAGAAPLATPIEVESFPRWKFAGLDIDVVPTGEM